MKNSKFEVSLQRWLSESKMALGIWTGLFAFISYFSMYMIRKPFTAGQFESDSIWGIDFKVAIIIAQVMGYALSKFIGIRVISSMTHQKRVLYFTLLLSVATLSLGMFMVVPSPFSIICFFFNGLPLGMIWGLVFSYLEGRKITEILTAILSTNFILSSGIAKTLGSLFLLNGVSEKAMPFLCAIIFLPIAILCFYLLSLTPPASKEDNLHRKVRTPMTKTNRRTIFQIHGIAITLFTLSYIVLTVIRDIRDNFAVEIWKEMKIPHNIGIYTLSELPIALILLIGIALLYRIKNNSNALKFMNAIMLLMSLILMFSTLLFDIGSMHGVIWMIVTGSVLFIPYILFNGILFDRYIATFKVEGNTGYFMYVVDAFGYLASALILLSKNLWINSMEWLNFYIQTIYYGGAFLGILLIILNIYIMARLKTEDTQIALT